MAKLINKTRILYFVSLIVFTGTVLTSTVAAQDLVQFDFKVKPTINNTCITNNASVNSDPNKPPEGQTSAITQIGNVANGCSTKIVPGKLNLKFNFSGLDNKEQDLIKQSFDSVAVSPQAIQIYTDAYNNNGGVLTITKDGLNKPFAQVVGSCGNAYILIHAGLYLGSSLVSTQYVIIHEFGHIMRSCNGTLSQAYINSGAYQAEGLVVTYPLSAWFDIYPDCASALAAKGENESFAEMIADYVTYKTYAMPSTRICTNFPAGATYSDYPTRQPLFYNFVKNNIFGGVEF